MKTNKLSEAIFIVLIIGILSLTLACSSTSSYASTDVSASTHTLTPSDSASGQVYKLSFALFQPSTDPLSVINTEFAQDIEKLTNGRVQITVGQEGSLLDATEMFQGVKNDIVDMGNCVTSYNSGSFPFTGIAELPVPADDGWVLTNAVYDFLMKYQPKEWNDVHLLMPYGTGADILSVDTVKAPILNLEEWKGKAIRTNLPNIVTALGGNAREVTMSSLYDALLKNIVDGAIGDPEMLKSWKLGDITKYVVLMGPGPEPSTIWYNVMNKSKWNSLPPHIQKTITDLSNEYKEKLALAWDSTAIAGIKYAKDAGDSITVLSQDETDRWMAAITPAIESYLQKLTSTGYTQQEVQDAWNYFQSRVQYWNGQMAANNITPLMDQMQNVIH